MLFIINLFSNCYENAKNYLLSSNFPYFKIKLNLLYKLYGIVFEIPYRRF